MSESTCDDNLTVWRCFHCGFETADTAEAAAHFGDRDDAEEFKPLCKWWASMTPEERGETLQDCIQELNEERDENAVLRTRVEGLEHRLQEFENVIDARFPGCRSINDIFHRYDTTEGLKLVAEAEVARLSQPVARCEYHGDYPCNCPQPVAESAEPGPSDTEMLDWLRRTWEAGKQTPTFDPTSMNPMCEWAWHYGDDKYGSFRDAIRAAMRKETTA